MAQGQHIFSVGIRGRLGITLFALVVVLILFTRFLAFVEARQGIVFADPLLTLFTPIDVTWLTFALIYGALLLALGYLLRHPVSLLLALQSYTLLVVTRMAAMFLLPLDPPVDMLPLVDPIVELAGSGGVTLSRDLFFSGHTSTLFLLALVIPNLLLRTVFVCCTVLVGCCVVLQHVHYSIDVVAAPFFAYTCVAVVQKAGWWQPHTMLRIRRENFL